LLIVNVCFLVVCRTMYAHAAAATESHGSPQQMRRRRSLMAASQQHRLTMKSKKWGGKKLHHHWCPRPQWSCPQVSGRTRRCGCMSGGGKAWGWDV